jgi:hypothetical protein
MTIHEADPKFNARLRGMYRNAFGTTGRNFHAIDNEDGTAHVLMTTDSGGGYAVVDKCEPELAELLAEMLNVVDGEGHE